VRVVPGLCGHPPELRYRQGPTLLSSGFSERKLSYNSCYAGL
jgi:hypothetical protein